MYMYIYQPSALSHKVFVLLFYFPYKDGNETRPDFSGTGYDSTHINENDRPTATSSSSSQAAPVVSYTQMIENVDTGESELTNVYEG